MACSLKKTNGLGAIKSGIWIFMDDFDGINKPVVCKQCKNPPCEKACPLDNEKPIRMDKRTGIVFISNDKRCMNCYECVDACAFGAIRIDPEEGKPVKCDLCDGDPECVRWCHFGAISYRNQRRPGQRITNRR
jgi:Fe-S-cluster-containing hydrogenase component 2